MQLLQGISMGEVEFTARSGLKVRRRLPAGDSSSDRYAFSGKSQPIYRRMPPRIGGGLEFLECTRFAVLVNRERDALLGNLRRFMWLLLSARV